MSTIASTIATAVTGLQAQLLLVAAAGITLGAVIFGVKYGWQVFRTIARKS